MVKRLSVLVTLGLLSIYFSSALQVGVNANPPDEGVLLPALVREEGEGIAPCYTGCGGENPPAVRADYEQQVVDLVNAERASRGLPPFKQVASLGNAARYHARDMGEDDYFDHATYDRVAGVLTYVCDTWTRIETYHPNPLAENAAAGQWTPQSVMDAWMGSTGHRNNILSTTSWEIGVGYYEGSGYYYRYWVQDFGRRSGVYPLIINRDAEVTTSRDVSLYIYGTWTEVRLRNDGGAWSAWMPFQNELDWTLGAAAGERTVYAEMQTASNSASSSDAIYLDAATLPALGNLPDSVAFTYTIQDQSMQPVRATLTPANVSTEDPLTWVVTKSGSWFSVTPSSGSTPDSFAIEPSTSSFDTQTVGTYTGQVTVTVTDPGEVEGSPHQIDVTLHVVSLPVLGNLPDNVEFFYSIQDQSLQPVRTTLTPANEGTADPLTWAVTRSGSWFSVTPSNGSTPSPFAIEPSTSSIDTQTVGMYTGQVTVTVTNPGNVEGSPHQIGVTLYVVGTEFYEVYMPMVVWE